MILTLTLLSCAGGDKAPNDDSPADSDPVDSRVDDSAPDDSAPDTHGDGSPTRDRRGKRNVGAHAALFSAFFAFAATLR